MSEYTKGPWDFVGRYIEQPDKEKPIGEIYGHFPSKEMIANAYLIAAAPELLGACKCALADLEGIMPAHDPDGDREHSAWKTIKELQDVIAKAEGQKSTPETRDTNAKPIDAPSKLSEILKESVRRERR